MNTLYNLKQGEDLIMEIPVFDASGVAVNLTTATDMVVTLTNAKVVQAKYSLVVQAGYGTVSIKTGVGNEHILEVQIKREESKAFAVGYTQSNVLIELPDVLLTDKRSEYNYPAIMLVAEGYTKDEIVD